MYVCMYVVCKKNFVLYEYVYGTYRHTHRFCLHGATGDFYVYVYRPYDDECETPVCTNRTKHTDYSCKRRILNYGHLISSPSSLATK
jgi:hypothetical protein